MFMKVYVQQVFVNVRQNFISSGHYVRQVLKNYLQPWLAIFSNMLNKLSLVKFQVCNNFISFLTLKIVIECSEDIFKNLVRVIIYLYGNS